MFLKNFRSSGMLPKGSPNCPNESSSPGAWPSSFTGMAASLLIITTAGWTALTASRKLCDSARAGAAAGFLLALGMTAPMLASDAANNSPHITGTTAARNGSRLHTTFLKKLIALSFQNMAQRGTVQDASDFCRPQVEKN